ncbi:hypothetical protein pEaSNUABM11_00080 [Erwinia phage pEa_SNUABM_11]|nr:hypothetical protein pEaSNUABM11_00080 [Erwinia phage pEa_SNUABM_11]
MKTINSEMKALVKTSPLYLMLLVCAEECGFPETTQDILKWEADNMPKFRDVISRPTEELPREVQLIKAVLSPEFDKPFEANDLHGMIDEFIARAAATPELQLTEEEIAIQGDVTTYYTAAKERFANA